MGLRLGPTFANIFVCAQEDSWLDGCPLSFKPAFYIRYMDDFFLIFSSRSDSIKFYDYVNQKHPNINFTLEHEANRQLTFLDCNETRTDNHFTTYVSRKPTFIGLGASFFSFCSFRFELNSVVTLLNRAYDVSSKYHLMHTGFGFRTSFLHCKSYPRKLIKNHINKFLTKKTVRF